MITRRDLIAAGVSAGALGALGRPAAAAFPPPEQPSIKVGTAVTAMSFLPVYVAYARTWKAQGLDVQLFQFRGDAEVATALVGGSIDVRFGSFYGGFHQADFSWLAQPNVKHWSDLKGKSMGISTYGSLTDALTRFAIRRNKLDPEKDIQVAQGGTT